MPTSRSYDIAVVGAGICGLAHARAAARRGKRVVVVDRDAQANGASIRNFGFITVKIPVLQRGMLMIARRPEARGVIEARVETEMGDECELVESSRLSTCGSGLRAEDFAGALFSQHEARVESREAIPKLAAWLDVSEGRNAGVWTVGVSVRGNCFGLSREDAAALPPADFRERREAAAKRLEGTGAHCVIDSVADLMPVALQIEARLQRGERP
jgi:hypothetical protein